MHLSPNEKRTFLLHLVYMMLDGIVLGVLALNEFVFIKSLGGSNYQMGLLFQFSMLVFLLLILINEWQKRVRKRQNLLRITGLLTRLPLLLMLITPAHTGPSQAWVHYLFLAVFLIYYLGNVIIYPNINYLLKNNYDHHNFGKLYSYATSLNKVMMLVVTFVYGYYLDQDGSVYRIILPLVGVLSAISVFILTAIKMPEQEIAFTQNGVFKSVSRSIREMTSILRENVPYRHFELGFMIYGAAFMITYTVITIYFYEGLDLNYSSVAFYRNSYNILAIILLPFFGKLLGTIDPRRFAAMTFTALALYILSVGLTELYKGYWEFWDIRLYYTIVGYILFQGIFAATMVLLWNIGSSYFCTPKEAGTYQSLHLSLTGVRAIFAPLAGVVVYELTGFLVTFMLGVVLALLAVLLMIWSYRRDQRITAKASP